jgi:carboxymethylenebutenolidase
MTKTTMVEFRANGRTAQGYLASPDAGTGPGVLVIQEWWGLVDHIKSVTERFAAAGFVALAPDLYHGDSTTKPDEAGKLMMALNIAEAAKDLRGAAEYLLTHDRVEPKKVGAVGFCMGGQLALFAGCEHPDKIAAVVDFYGIHPAVNPNVDALKGPVLAHFGNDDGFVKESDARALVARIEAAGKQVEAHFYAAGHAFFNDSRPEAHDASASALAWDRTIAFLRTHLT